MQLKNLIKRYYTKKLEDHPELTVYDLFEYKIVDVKMIDHKTGKVLCDMKNLEFPKDYSQNACNIIASKYFRKAGVPNGYGYERSIKEVVHRLVGFWTAAALDEGLIADENKNIFYDEVAYLLLSQRFAPNSPQWFNTGLKWAYNITKESDGHFYYDIEKDKVVKSKDAYTRTQGSACFIISINDALLGKKSITEQLVTETRLFKQGSGTGTNFSTLRAKGEKLSGGGTSSGLMSFLKVFDRNAGAIKSGGTTRRAAKIVCLDIDHPEIEDFIDWKVREEKKVIALGKMGYDTDFNGEAYETVSGQNSNNSIVITNEFMNKVIGTNSDTTWKLKGRIDPSVNRIIDAKELWKKFNYASWFCGDPAVQFHDTINAWNTCSYGEDGKGEKIRSSNPCSEYYFLDDTACNLLSHNIIKYYDYKTNSFDIEGFLHAVTLAQIILEVTIHWGQFPTEDIARRSHYFRTTGQGIANTGALHLLMLHPYDSDEARTVAATLMGIVTGRAYFVSALIAKEIGPFPKYHINKKSMLKVIRNHSRVAGILNDDFEDLDYIPLVINHDILNKEGLSSLSNILKQVWTDALEYGYKYGYRNAQVSVIAPTGTISLAMDCATTSIEPFFAHTVYKKLAGGGMIKIVNPYIKIALKKLGYNNKEIKEIENHILEGGNIENAPHLLKKHLSIFDTAAGDSRTISPMGHVKYVAALSPLVSGGISKTVNLPNSATIEDFEKIHIESWKLGIKGIALYRDGCKASQPLNSIKNNKERKLEDMTYTELLEMVKKLQNELEKVRTKSESISSIVENTIDEDEEVPEGYKKVVCTNCGSIAMIPNGTCHICLNCGSTTGCS